MGIGGRVSHDDLGLRGGWAEESLVDEPGRVSLTGDRESVASRR